MSSTTIRKIFIVDDDPIFSAMLAGHLNKNKMLQLFHFSSGEACLNELHQGPDIIILDYILNAVHAEAADGLAILEKIKKKLPHVRVVMLSSQTHYGVAARTIAKGAEQYVIKDENALTAVEDLVNELI